MKNGFEISKNHTISSIAKQKEIEGKLKIIGRCLNTKNENSTRYSVTSLSWLNGIARS